MRVGLGNDASRVEVVGELGRGTHGARVGQLRASLEAAGKPLVEATAGPWQQLGLDDLAQQLVPEATAARDGLKLQHASVERGTETFVDLRLGDVQHLREQAVIDRSTGDRSRVDERPGARIEARDPRQQDVDDGSRALGHPGCEQLLDEQRVAFRAPPDAVHHAGGGIATRDHAQLSLDGVALESPQLQGDGGSGPLDLHEPGEDRVPPGQVIDAAGQDDRQALRREVP